MENEMLNQVKTSEEIAEEKLSQEQATTTTAAPMPEREITNGAGCAEKPVEIKKKSAIAIIAVIAVVFVLLIAVVGGVLAVVLIGPSVDSIELSMEEAKMMTDDTIELSYTILPEKAAETKVQWTSSDENVVTVDENGKITAVGEGTCTITATAKKQTDSLEITVSDTIDFNAIYAGLTLNVLCCEVASDGSYMSFDTNPFNLDDFTTSGSLDNLEAIIEALGLPESLIADMYATRALDGRQTQSFEKVTVSWCYHPDNGLEVLFKNNQ